MVFQGVLGVFRGLGVCGSRVEGWKAAVGVECLGTLAIGCRCSLRVLRLEHPKSSTFRFASSGPGSISQGPPRMEFEKLRHQTRNLECPPRLSRGG